MVEVDIKTWEIDNASIITGWEIHYGCEETVDGVKTWINYGGYKIINFKSGKEIKFQIQFIGGHYVAGSYTHDYTAAASYLKVLHKHMGSMQFEWKSYDSGNGHSYFFETIYTVGKTKFKNGVTKQKV